MNERDYKEISKHINILNVAYHTNIEMTEKIGNEIKAICPFCGYKDNKRESNLKLNYITNKYHCFKCGKSGYSVGLYAKLNYIDNKQAFKELMNKGFFSIDASNLDIVTTNPIANIDYRNSVYTEFLNMLDLDISHKRYLQRLGYTITSIQNCNFKSIPKNKITRKLICNKLKTKHNLEGIPGFYLKEDLSWDFISPSGILIPVYDDENRIQGITIHLDKEFNNCKDLWFSSSNKIAGTTANNCIATSNITEETNTVILTDNLLDYNLIKETVDYPIIGFCDTTNSYHILKELKYTNIENIIFTIRSEKHEQKLDYLIEKVFKDLFTKGYDISFKFINDYKDLLKENFLEKQKLQFQNVA